MQKQQHRLCQNMYTKVLYLILNLNDDYSTFFLFFLVDKYANLLRKFATIFQVFTVFLTICCHLIRLNSLLHIPSEIYAGTA